MKYLVTGGAGFIGSHLSEALLNRGDSVIALDDLSTGSAENIDSFRKDPRFTFVNGNILDAQLVEQLISSVDGNFHFAAAVGVQKISDTEHRYNICISSIIPKSPAILAGSIFHNLVALPQLQTRCLRSWQLARRFFHHAVFAVTLSRTGGLVENGRIIHQLPRYLRLVVNNSPLNRE